MICSGPLSIDSAARLVIAWKIFAVMPPLICRIRRRDFGVSTVGRRSGMFRKMDETSGSNCSLAAHLFKVSSPNRRDLLLLFLRLTLRLKLLSPKERASRMCCPRAWPTRSSHSCWRVRQPRHWDAPLPQAVEKVARQRTAAVFPGCEADFHD